MNDIDLPTGKIDSMDHAIAFENDHHGNPNLLNGSGLASMNLPKDADSDFNRMLDDHSLESMVEKKICRFLDQIGSYYPENVYEMIMRKVEAPLLKQILIRTGGNQVHAARILGINRNTLRKKMKLFGYDRPKDSL